MQNPSNNINDTSAGEGTAREPHNLVLNQHTAEQTVSTTSTASTAGSERPPPQQQRRRRLVCSYALSPPSPV